MAETVRIGPATHSVLAEIAHERGSPSTPRSRNPFRIAVRPPEGGMALLSYVIGEQTRTISAGQLYRRLGAVSPATMTRVSEVVRILLGL